MLVLQHKTIPGLYDGLTVGKKLKFRIQVAFWGHAVQNLLYNGAECKCSGANTFSKKIGSVMNFLKLSGGVYIILFLQSKSSETTTLLCFFCPNSTENQKIDSMRLLLSIFFHESLRILMYQLETSGSLWQAA